MTWIVGLLLLAPSGLSGAVDASRVSRSGLGIIVSEAGGPIILQIAPDTPRTPASNQKVLTAALALKHLGKDFEFRTVLARAANGALVVRGDGDPNFSGRFFDGDPNRVLRELARDLKKRGVDRIRNGIVLDATSFDDEWQHADWPRDQLERWYCAPVAALVFNDSCWDINVRPGPNAGDRANVEVQPSLLKPHLAIECPTVVVRSRHVVHIGRIDGGFSVRGGILRGSTGISSHLTVKDPVMFFGNALRAALIAEGVPVEGTVRRGVDPDAKPLFVYKSSLERTLKVMLASSQNLYAECVFKRAGGGSFKKAAERLKEFGNVQARDGSGMSSRNRVAPSALHKILTDLRNEPTFVNALAIGGEGTLRKRYRSLGKRIQAKTGYIAGVSSLSGYVTSRANKRYVFVILCNGKAKARARPLQDKIVSILAGAR
jgi:D-alanyl-D-alanine carboxypeptidase/D-alanyl-D-alanine-endopeptidase (penicillin-binding protein 4)